ncbi:MAG: DUF1002 domain-containing protein [Candidatus Syntrophonatronum acetioxidans]|uniref:DUF1002 domain-containing protein n=1 Tax=Candidatus Syntrophonatronum acetioxidans TaxID=1795816 RepID=A0A424Y989_9FIRM|nr:MAG: DUF1002 domain-containing protein [Candidatus Syntrophonatronum acetioxidans]
MKKCIGAALILLLLFSLSVPAVAQGGERTVVTLGNDLSSSQREEMLSYFGVKEDEVEILIVTNEEEYHYLRDVATPAELGTRAISSAYLEILPDGEGLEIRTHNITWVTESMYANALVTAGVHDAQVVAAAPFPVSGTAALTGMIKAFEEATGELISEEQKETAHQELYLIGELSEETGEKEKVSELFWKVKEEVIREQLRDSDQIRDIVINISQQIELNLTDEQVERIVEMMERISYLDISIQDVRDQFQKFIEEHPEVRGWLEVIFEWLSKLLENLLEMLRT